MSASQAIVGHEAHVLPVLAESEVERRLRRNRLAAVERTADRKKFFTDRTRSIDIVEEECKASLGNLEAERKSIDDELRAKLVNVNIEISALKDKQRKLRQDAREPRKNVRKQINKVNRQLSIVNDVRRLTKGQPVSLALSKRKTWRPARWMLSREMASNPILERMSLHTFQTFIDVGETVPPFC